MFDRPELCSGLHGFFIPFRFSYLVLECIILKLWVIPYLIYAIILVVAAAFPTLGILIWLLSGERGRRERWQDVLYIFFLGAFVSAFVALIFESLAIYILSSPVLGEYDLFARDPTALTFLVSIVIAPFVEEFAKLLIVLRSSNRIWRPRNGLVFGAAVGLGFSATENFLYGIAALTTAGIIVFLALIMSRTVLFDPYACVCFVNIWIWRGKMENLFRALVAILSYCRSDTCLVQSFCILW